MMGDDMKATIVAISTALVLLIGTNAPVVRGELEENKYEYTTIPHALQIQALWEGLQYGE